MLFTESGRAQVRRFKSTFCQFYSHHLNNRTGPNERWIRGTAEHTGLTPRKVPLD